MIPQIQHVVTVEKGWLDDEEMLDCIAIGQSLPGVIAINIATYVGYRKRGLAGAAAATFGVVLPAFVSILILAALLSFIGDNRFVEGAFMGIKAAVCGLLIVTSIRLLLQMCGKGKGSRQVKRSQVVFTVIVSLASLVAVGFLGITAILVILAGIVIGIVYYRIASLKGSQEADQ